MRKECSTHIASGSTMCAVPAPHLHAVERILLARIRLGQRLLGLAQRLVTDLWQRGASGGRTGAGRQDGMRKGMA